MKTYIVGYDLNKPGQHYTDLIKTLEGFGTYWHHLDSTWIIKSDLTTIQIRDKLQPLIDSNDELLVVRLQGDWATLGINESGNKWLHNNMSYE